MQKLDGYVLKVGQCEDFRSSEGFVDLREADQKFHVLLPKRNNLEALVGTVPGLQSQDSPCNIRSRTTVVCGASGVFVDIFKISRLFLRSSHG